MWPIGNIFGDLDAKLVFSKVRMQLSLLVISKFSPNKFSQYKNIVCNRPHLTRINILENFLVRTFSTGMVFIFDIEHDTFTVSSHRFLADMDSVRLSPGLHQIFCPQNLTRNVCSQQFLTRQNV